MELMTTYKYMGAFHPAVIQAYERFLETDGAMAMLTPPPDPKLRLELYPPIDLPTFPPTWGDIQRLALHYPPVRHAVVMVERGDWTREQALIMLAFALAQSFQKLFSAEVDRLARTPPDVRMLIPAKSGYRIVWVDASTVYYEHLDTKERIPVEWRERG